MDVTLYEKIRLYKDAVLALRNKELRNMQKVEEDYETGIYKKYVDAEMWSGEYTSFGLIDPDRLNANKLRYYRSNEKIQKDSYKKILELGDIEFTEVFKRFIDKDDEIVELGCGYGKNLFELRMNGFKNIMTGYDISKNAIITAKKINEKSNFDIDFDVMNMVDVSKYDLKNKTIFTVGALEQTKYQLEEILKKLIDAKAKQIIHIECIPQLLPKNIFGLCVAINRRRKDYQTELLNILEKYPNKISITHLEKMKTCFSVFNPIMMVRYQMK